MRTKPSKSYGGSREGAGRKPLVVGERAQRHTVTLLESQAALLKVTGEGNLSAGIRITLERLNNLERSHGLLQAEGVDNVGELVGGNGGGSEEGTSQPTGRGVRGQGLTPHGNMLPEEGKTIRVYWGLMNQMVWAKVHHISDKGIVYAQRSTKYRGLTKPRRIYDTDYGWSIYKYGL